MPTGYVSLAFVTTGFVWLWAVQAQNGFIAMISFYLGLYFAFVAVAKVMMLGSRKKPIYLVRVMPVLWRMVFLTWDTRHLKFF